MNSEPIKQIQQRLSQIQKNLNSIQKQLNSKTPSKYDTPKNEKKKSKQYGRFKVTSLPKANTPKTKNSKVTKNPKVTKKHMKNYMLKKLNEPYPSYMYPSHI